MRLTDTFIRTDDVVCRFVEGETLIVPVRGKVGDLASIYSLKGVGVTVWNALAEPRSIQELTELIISEYEISREQASVDLESFLRDLLGRGLCRVVSEK